MNPIFSTLFLILGLSLSANRAMGEGLRIESIHFEEEDFWDDWSGWVDLTDEIEKIRADLVKVDKGGYENFQSSFYQDSPGYGDVMNSIFDPKPRLLEQAAFLILGDSGRLLRMSLQIRNTSEKPIELAAIRLVVDDFLARRTPRGSGSLELETLDLDPAPEVVVLSWPVGYFETPRDEHIDRAMRGDPLKSETGYNSTETRLDRPLTIPTGSVQSIDLEIPTKYYPDLGFGCSHYLMHFDLITPEKEFSTDRIYWIGSHWWMFKDE